MVGNFSLKVEKGEKAIYTIGAIVASVLLFLAIGRHPYGYFTTLRWITCAVSCYGAYLFYKLDVIYIVIPLGVTAILFNPLIPIYLNRSTWHVIDVISGCFLLFTLVVIWRPKYILKTTNKESNLKGGRND